MKIRRKKALFLTLLTVAGTLLPGGRAVSAEKESGPAVSAAGVRESTAMYRLYHPNTCEHFYTASVYERDVLSARGWKYEGIGWYAPVKSEIPVYRLYHPVLRDHHYTVSAHERDVLSARGWKYEGIGWYSCEEKEVPLYRLYCPRLRTGSHHYTTSRVEAQHLASCGWIDEGIAWYGENPDGGDGQEKEDALADRTYTVVCADGKRVQITGHYEPAASARLTEAVAAYRNGYGIGAQTVSESLVRGAKVRAVEVCAVKSHVRPDGTDFITASTEALAENFMNYGTSPEEILAAWKVSPRHNGNLLHETHRRIGIAVFARRISGMQEEPEYRYAAVALWG